MGGPGGDSEGAPHGQGQGEDGGLHLQRVGDWGDGEVTRLPASRLVAQHTLLLVVYY